MTDALAQQIANLSTSLEQGLQQRQRVSTQLLTGIGTHEQRIDKGIWDAVHMLPTKLLIKHGKQGYVQGRALEEWRDLWRRRNLRLKMDAWGLWLRFVQDEANTFRKQSGALIVRIARGFLGRLRVRALRRKLDAANVKAQRLAAMKFAFCWRSLKEPLCRTRRC
jgi:hypothetical protein